MIFFSSRRRHTRCALVTGVQTCALPIFGVLGTDTTVRQPYVDRLSAEFASDCLVLRHGSARLVELAEAKLRGGAAAPAEYRAALEGLISQPGGDRMDKIGRASCRESVCQYV